MQPISSSQSGFWTSQPTPINTNPGGQYLNQIQGAMAQNTLPSAQDLAARFPFSLQTPQGNQLLSQTANLLTQTGPVGQERATQLALLLSQGQQQGIMGNLSTGLQNLDPRSAEFQMLQSRVAANQMMNQQTAQMLGRSMGQDIFSGGAGFLQSPITNMNTGSFGSNTGFAVPMASAMSVSPSMSGQMMQNQSIPSQFLMQGQPVEFPMAQLMGQGFVQNPASQSSFSQSPFAQVPFGQSSVNPNWMNQGIQGGMPMQPSAVSVTPQMMTPQGMTPMSPSGGNQSFTNITNNQVFNVSGANQPGSNQMDIMIQQIGDMVQQIGQMVQMMFESFMRQDIPANPSAQEEPSINASQLIGMYQNLDPSSPEAEQVAARIYALQRSELHGQDSVLGQMYGQLSMLEPESPEAQMLQMRISNYQAQAA